MKVNVIYKKNVKVNVIYKKNVKVNVIYKTKWKTKDTALSEQFQNQIEKSKKQTKSMPVCSGSVMLVLLAQTSPLYWANATKLSQYVTYYRINTLICAHLS